jgi:hypothetical protein
VDQDWILQKRETRRTFATSTWVTLRSSQSVEHGDCQFVGYTNEFFGCGSVAFLPEYKAVAEELDWSSIGLGHDVQPCAYKDGYYAPIEQYQINDKEPAGVNLVFEHPQPVVGGRLWILNPDLVVALRLIKDGANWVRPEENFVVVAREELDDEGHQVLIEIKREFLVDYLAARNLSLRLTYYRERVENVASLAGSPYEGLTEVDGDRDGGRFALGLRALGDIYGGSYAAIRVSRIDVDEDDDNPVMGPETDTNTESESWNGHHSAAEGVRVEGQFWRHEWIEHQGLSLRVRRDTDPNRPQFIVETDGTRMASAELCDEDIGRWLFFRSNVINTFLGHRGFSLGWYTAETGYIKSTSGRNVHFGINSADLITVYAYDIARLNTWEQHIWVGQNVVSDGKVATELLASQVRAKPADTLPPEVKLFKVMRKLEAAFLKEFGVALFNREIDDSEAMQQVSRFVSVDRASLLRLAKELIRVFSDRLNIKELRNLATRADKDDLRSNKLLEDVLAQKIGPEKARDAFGVIAGVYDMRVGDAHPTSNKITEAIELAGVDEDRSYLRQGEQLIHNFGLSVARIGMMLFGPPKV